MGRCNVCGGFLVYLGRLGSWFWYECQDCRAEKHVDWNELELEDDYRELRAEEDSFKFGEDG